jgi:hypothetical protein
VAGDCHHQKNTQWQQQLEFKDLTTEISRIKQASHPLSQDREKATDINKTGTLSQHIINP